MADNSSLDLDQLLDSALDDFDLAPSPSSSRRKNVGSPTQQGTPHLLAQSAPPPQVQGLGSGLSDLRTKKGKQKKGAGLRNDSHVSEAVEKLTQQTREAVRGLGSALPTNLPAGELGSDEMVEELVKQFEQFAAPQDMESMIEKVMQQLLSKEILHEPMKEMADKYPKWLEEHKSQLKHEEYDRYWQQYELILELNGVYETEPNNFTKVVDLMQKMQECGQPPEEIVQDLAPGLDLAAMGAQLSPEMLDANPNCCIM